MPHVHVNGARLEYDVRGAGPLVVMANGLFQRIDRWDSVLPYLNGYRVLRYDMRGQGGSELTDVELTPDVHASDLRALLGELRVARYSLVGLSNGGVVAQAFAADPHPGLERVAIVASTPFLDVALRAKLVSWRDALDRGGTLLRMQVSTPWAFGRVFLAHHPELLDPVVLERSLPIAPTAVAQRRLLAGLLAMPDMRSRLPHVRAPTLVISGEDDLLFPPEYGAEIARSTRGARFHVQVGVGHQPPIEDPAGFAQTLRAFLDEHTNAPTWSLRL